MTGLEICVLVVCCIVFLFVISAYMARDFGWLNGGGPIHPPPMRRKPRFPTCDWCSHRIKVDSRGQCCECGAPVRMRTYIIEAPRVAEHLY